MVRPRVCWYACLFGESRLDAVRSKRVDNLVRVRKGEPSVSTSAEILPGDREGEHI